jgi:hypothetical protein
MDDLAHLNARDRFRWVNQSGSSVHCACQLQRRALPDFPIQRRAGPFRGLAFFVHVCVGATPEVPS